MAYYEAGEPSRLRKFYKQRGSANEVVQRGAAAIRTQARHLARNHDLARGALRVLVNNVVGPNGIGIEPQPRRPDGTIHAEYAEALREAWADWCRYPEVTHRLPWSRLQRAMPAPGCAMAKYSPNSSQARAPTLTTAPLSRFRSKP